MKCRHRPQTFKIINLNPFRTNGTPFVDRRVQHCKKCGEKIEIKHPVWFASQIRFLLILLYLSFRFIEIYMISVPTEYGIRTGFWGIRVIVICVILLYRFGYLLAGWKTTTLDSPPPITWQIENEKADTTFSGAPEESKYFQSSSKFK